VERVDVLVVGAGLTGIACACFAAKRGLSTCLVERHGRAGLETSTHNSGVVHAGLYYPAGSLKAVLSVEGRERLYEFCARRGVAHRRCGKLVVAGDESELAPLEALKRRAEANGVRGLEIVDRRFIAAREPHVRAAAALYSPDSGIVSAEALVAALLAEAGANGAVFLPGTSPIGAEPHGDAVAVRTERETIVADTVVNAAGLYADEVSALLGGERFTIYPCRGEYAELAPAKQSLVNALVYPLPHPSGHGLGVHLTKSTGGNVWIGPTIRYQQRKDDYEDGREPLDAFVEPTRLLLPGVTIADLRLSGSGIRAKLHPPSESFADFLIRRDRENPAIVQASGIDSPGLTSCLAIGALVSRIVAGEPRASAMV